MWPVNPLPRVDSPSDYAADEVAASRRRAAVTALQPSEAVTPLGGEEDEEAEQGRQHWREPAHDDDDEPGESHLIDVAV